MLKDILEYNKKFVENKEYEQYKTTKYPNKKIAILSCMDTRLTHLLPAAMGLSNGDVKIIKNAGAIIDHPYGSGMRSLLVAIYNIGVEEIYIVGHDDCGMECIDSNKMIIKMIDRGIKEEDIMNINNFYCDLTRWLHGFDSLNDSVKKTANLVKDHPLVPDDIKVVALIINPETGALRELNLN